MSEYLSLKPSDAADSGGGLFDDFDGGIVGTAYVRAKYGSMTEPRIMAKVDFKNDAAERPFDVTYSMGDMAGWDIVEGGRKLQKVATDAKPLNKSSNWYIFLKAMVGAGYPEDQLQADITSLVGLKGHLKNITRQVGRGTDKKDAKVLCFTTITHKPWETTEAKGGKANGAAAEDDKDAALAAVAEVVAKSKKGLSADQIKVQAFTKVLLANPRRNEIKALITPELLQTGVEAGLWTLDGEVYVSA